MHAWRIIGRRTTIVSAVLAMLSTSLVLLPAGQVAAAVPANDVYVWGARPGASVASIYGTPVRGSGSVTTGATTSANPGGGGTINALLSGSTPVNKLSVLKAFGGGIVRSVVDSPRTRTMYAAVESPSGVHQIWQWSTSYLNPTLFWTADSGESIIKIAAYRDQSNRQAQVMITERSSGRRVYAWGSNDGYWTGLGLSSGTTSTPTEITSLRNIGIRDVTVGYLSMLAVDSSGDVWAWGNDAYSQLGLTSTTAQTVPVELTNANTAGGVAPAGIVEIDMGHVGVIARSASGILTWGYNSSYAGRSSSTANPTALTLTGCTATSASWSVYIASSTVYSSSVVGCSEGGARAWGNNTYGQLGDTTTTARTSPVSVQGLPAGVAVTQVDGGAAGAFALTSTGAVYAWGSNLYRQLGISANYATGVTIYKTAQLSSRVTHPSSGSFASVWGNEFTGGVIDSTGLLFTWGNAAYGLLGRGTKGPSSTATGARFDRIGVVDGTGVELVDSTDRGTVMVLSDGSVWTLGYNDINNWNNGDGGSGTRLWPGKIDLPIGPDTAFPNERIVRLTCGANHCLVATNDGRIFGWGDQTYKQILPTASTAANAYNTPTLVVDLTSVPRIAAGRYFSLYVEPGVSGGTVYGWGYNSNRAASPDGTVTTALTAFSAVTSVPNVVDVSAGWYHSSVVRADGSVAAWGSNGAYELGNTLKTNVAPYWNAPTLPSAETAVSVHAVGRATIVRTSTGRLVGWGTNYYGILGTGTNAAVTAPAYVATALTNDAEVVALDTFMSQVTTSVFYTALTVAVDENGRVWSWGANAYGQLGADVPAATSGANLYRYSPQPVRTSGGSQLSSGDVPVAGAGWGMSFTPITSRQLPSAPQSVAAVAGNAQVAVSWSPPSTPADLRSYTVIARSGGSVAARVGASSSSTTATVTGLTNGVEYSFTVTATNEYGTSAESTAVTAMPVSVPSAPRNLTVAPGTTSVSVGFDDPTSDGGSAITGYTVMTRRTSDNGVQDSQTIGASGSRPVTVTGLTAGSGYSVSVVATSAQGSSLAATETLVIAGRPTAPEDVTASGRVGSAVVSWNPPTHDGGTPITSYYVRAYTSGTSTLVASDVVTSGLSTTLTGLTDGAQYDITVTAAQDAITPPTLLGVPSDIAQVIPGRPAAPTDVSASPGNAQATLTWTAVSDVTGISVTGYTLSADAGGTPITASVTTSACSGSTCTGTLTGLTNGTTYTLKVAATSAAGSGPFSTSATATPRTVPTAPTSLTVAVADGGLDVSWATPTSTGGSDITQYTVTVSDGSGIVSQTTVSGTIETETVTGLTNGSNYTVEVTATNVAGSGPAVSNSATPLGAPSAPPALTLTPGTTSFTATWDAPTSTGGSSVTSYTLTVTDPQDVVTVLTTSGSGSCVTSTRTCTVTQVDDGSDSGTLETVSVNRPYTVSVVATNAQGDSAATSDVVVVTGQPSAPRSVTATSGDASFEMCLTVPATVPTGSITGYRLRISDDDGESYTSVVTERSEWVTTSASCTGGRYAFTVTSIGSSAPVNGTEYTVLASATTSTDPDANDWTFGMESTAVQVTPMTTPGAPSTLTAAASGDGVVTVTWTPPVVTGGSAITGYTLRYLPSGGAWTTYPGPLSSSDTTAAVSSLTAGTLYSFELTAVNVVGTGTAATDTARAITVPAAATVMRPLASSTLTTVVAEFAYATSAAAPVTTASLIAVPTSGTTVTQSVNLGAECSLGLCASTLGGLTSGATYAVSVRLTNAAGSTDATVNGITYVGTSSGGGSGSGSADPGAEAPLTPPSASTPSPGIPPSDDAAQDTPSEERCLARGECSGWGESDGTVRGPDGRLLRPIDDTSRWPDLPVDDDQPVDAEMSVLPVDVSLPAQVDVGLSWTRAVDALGADHASASTAGYLLQLRRFGAARWSTFESASSAVDVSLATRGYVFEARVLRNSDFSLVASASRFGVPLRARESITFAGTTLRSQRPQSTEVSSPGSLGGTVLVLEGASTLAQFRTTGDRLTIWYPTGSGLGTADVIVDGQRAGRLSQRADTTATRTLVLTGLGACQHSIMVVVTSGRVGIDAIGSGPSCAGSCQKSPTGVLRTTRGGTPTALGARSGASVGFVAPRAAMVMNQDARSVQLYLDGRPLRWNDRRLSYAGRSVEISGTAPRPHVLTLLPVDPGGAVTRAAAAGSRARPLVP